jgi:2-amino-4-hydroxy-6-hydroxymethyldihydropteridine diphosphokinase
MSLIIATGSNLGDKAQNLSKALEKLKSEYKLIASSRVYESSAVGITDQPSFFNQVLEFDLPHTTPQETMLRILSIEDELGRVRKEKWGPRLIDIDIIFWGLHKMETKVLTVPHPFWSQRSFVVEPLKELPFFQTLKKSFKIPSDFENTANPIST